MTTPWDLENVDRIKTYRRRFRMIALAAVLIVDITINLVVIYSR